jgi:hypothetical protein
MRLFSLVLNPFNRLAVAAFVWTHRRSILRWGRSFWAELRAPHRIEPQRLALIARVLWAITRDDRLAKARQLKRVSLDGDVVIVDASPRWSQRHRLVDVLSDVPGVSAVVDARGRRLAGSIDVTPSA